jgi:hypothetical protein
MDATGEKEEGVWKRKWMHLRIKNRGTWKRKWMHMRKRKRGFERGNGCT